MTGSLKVKNEKYYAVINYKDGSAYKQKWISLGLPTKNNKRKAEALLEEIKRKYEDEYSSPEGDMKFTKYIEKWLKSKRGSVEKSTWEGYQIYCERHIIPYFEPLGLSLRGVKPRHIKQYYLDKFSSGRLDGKEGGLSIPSLKKHSLVLNEVLKSAVIDELIDKNPASGVKLPAKDAPTREEVFLTKQEANELIKAFDGNDLQPLICITLLYGLRRSEVIGLKWSAIDFEKETLTINHTIVKNISIEEKDKTKTASSYHKYKLLPEAKEALISQKQIVEKYKIAFGEGFIDSDYVFVRPDGSFLRPDYVTRSFQKVLKKNGIKKMRFHDIRHSTASILYDEDWDMKDIQMWLRHSNSDITSNIYVHISNERESRISSGLSGIINFPINACGDS